MLSEVILGVEAERLVPRADAGPPQCTEGNAGEAEVPAKDNATQNQRDELANYVGTKEILRSPITDIKPGVNTKPGFTMCLRMVPISAEDFENII